MLIELSVKNFRSFRDRQTFSMVKGVGDEKLDRNTFESGGVESMQLLRSAAIYGPNASGKSNLLLALRTMKNVVLKSAVKLQRGDKLPTTPFRLSAETQGEPSEFEVIFLVDGVRYQYGFSATDERVHEEWLLAFPKRRAQKWVSRAWDPGSEQYEWELGHNLMGEKQLWQKSTRGNALFLSTAVHLNSEQLQPVFDWFKDTVRLSTMSGWSPSFSISMCAEKQKERIVDFLKAADLGIDDVLVESKPFNREGLPDDMPEPLRDLLAGSMEGKNQFDVRTVHKDDNGKPVHFDIEEESDGTQKLFSLAGPWLDALVEGRILLIDEVHNSLHPRLVQFLVELFHDSDANPKNAQLIFTTHETSILNQEVFRRDQIWFCEKKDDQATDLFPLTDFSPRKGRENLELAYLSGRYGAVPFVGSLKKAG